MKNLAAVLLVLFALAALAFGQATDAHLVGIVTDATGAVVPNANVEITHVGTGIKTSTKTNAQGEYRFNNIPVGFYNIAVTATGFAAANLKNVEIQLSKTSTTNVTLQVGSVATSVDVTEVGSVIDTTTAQVQANYGQRQVVNM